LSAFNKTLLADFNICPHLLVAWKGQQQVGRIDASSHHPRLYYFFLTSKVMLGGWNFSLSERERERAHNTILTHHTGFAFAWGHFV